MMHVFLSSNPCVAGEAALNPANGFVEKLRNVVVPGARCLFVCSNPDGHERTDYFAREMRAAFEKAGMPFSSLTVCDGRNADAAEALVRQSDLMILAGGHVPTQNAFFRRIGLRGLLRDYDGVIVGISAGSMNSAGTVYAMPELPGEVDDPGYLRFLPGLGLTDCMIIPHYGQTRDELLDGRRLFEDIAYPDSAGRRFYALVDGSYLYRCGDCQELCGESYLIENGALHPICGDGGRIAL